MDQVVATYSYCTLSNIQSLKLDLLTQACSKTVPERTSLVPESRRRSPAAVCSVYRRHAGNYNY